MIGIDEADFVVVGIRHIHIAKVVRANTRKSAKKRGRADAID